jgi:hypothetical protein
MSNEELLEAIGQAILDNKVSESGAAFAESVQEFYEKHGYMTETQRNTLEDIWSEFA